MLDMMTNISKNDTHAFQLRANTLGVSYSFDHVVYEC